MVKKLIGFMLMHLLNFVVALAITGIAFGFLTQYEASGNAVQYEGLFILFIVLPIVIIALTAALACLQFAGFQLWKGWEWQNPRKMLMSILGALIALFLPVSLITIYGQSSELWTWGWFEPVVMALMMLFCSLPMVLALIWQSENSTHKNKL